MGCSCSPERGWNWWKKLTNDRSTPVPIKYCHDTTSRIMVAMSHCVTYLVRWRPLLSNPRTITLTGLFISLALKTILKWDRHFKCHSVLVWIVHTTLWANFSGIWLSPPALCLDECSLSFCMRVDLCWQRRLRPLTSNSSTYKNDTFAKLLDIKDMKFVFTYFTERRYITEKMSRLE